LIPSHFPREKSKQASSINPLTGEDADMAQYEDEVELLPLDGMKGTFRWIVCLFVEFVLLGSLFLFVCCHWTA
jgi:hypothetical protein